MAALGFQDFLSGRFKVLGSLLAPKVCLGLFQVRVTCFKIGGCCCSLHHRVFP